MKRTDDFALIRQLDRVTDMVMDAPKALTALYLLRDTALRLIDLKPAGNPEAILQLMLRQARNGETDALCRNCHEMMFLLCGGTLPEGVGDSGSLYRRAEALRRFRYYADCLAPLCGGEEAKTLDRQRVLLEEMFGQELICRRAKCIGQLLEMRAKFNRLTGAMAFDADRASAEADALRCRHELLTEAGEKLRNISDAPTEISPRTAFDHNEGNVDNESAEKTVIEEC